MPTTAYPPWGTMQNKIHSDGQAHVEEILTLAAMRVVTDSSRYLLGYLKESGELRCELRIASLPRR